MSTEITFLGHSTVLLKNGVHTLLTDPVLSDRVMTLRRLVPLPIAPVDLPQPTALLISHGHYDHLDLHSLKFFSREVPIVLPPGLGKLVSKFVSNPLIELAHGASHALAIGLTISAFPVTHSPSRLSGINYRGCNGYWIEMNGSKIFFPGDSAYRTDFASFRDPDVALLPIGPCKHSWFMKKRCDLTPADAIRVMEETGAKKMIPIHWGTFKLGFEAPDAPMTKLKEIVSERSFGDRVAILQPGESLSQ